MAFVPNYTEADIGASVLDVTTKIILTIGTLITVVVVVFIYVYLKKKMK